MQPGAATSDLGVDRQHTISEGRQNAVIQPGAQHRALCRIAPLGQ